MTADPKIDQLRTLKRQALLGGGEHGVNRMELGPNNTKDGSDQFYRAIIEFAKR